MGFAERPAVSPPITDLSVASLVLVLIVSVVASFAMVIPGISGSFLLLLFGMNSTMQQAFSSLNLPFIAKFVVGHIIGVVLIARTITMLLINPHLQG